MGLHISIAVMFLFSMDKNPLQKSIFKMVHDGLVISFKNICRLNIFYNSISDKN